MTGGEGARTLTSVLMRGKQRGRMQKEQEVWRRKREAGVFQGGKQEAREAGGLQGLERPRNEPFPRVFQRKTALQTP